MGGVEILVGAETAGSHGFGVGFGTLEVGIGVGTVRLMGIWIGSEGGGMVRLGRVRISIVNCIDSHVYRV